MNIYLFYFFGATFLALLAFVVRHKTISYMLHLPFIALQVFFTIYQTVHLHDSEGYFKIDPLGLIFLILTTIVFIPVVIHSIIGAERRGERPREISIHNAALILFVAMMSGVLVSANIGLMWAFLEATTLASAALIYHERSATALEATWKYVFVASIGISFAFLGILFLGVTSKDANISSFDMVDLKNNILKMNATWLKMCFLFVVAGFSVKIGTVPLFTVDIDAKDAAPSPIGAMISGGLMNVGFVALFRFYELFAVTSIHAWMNTILMIIGVSSIFFATVYLLKVKNYKRMFAYSSLEHAGIAMVALSAGGVGYFACIFHLVVHSLIKSSLFFQVGQIYHIFKNKDIARTGNYFKINPLGGTILILGFLCITAIPPSGLFLSELLTFKSLLDSKQYIVAVFIFILLVFILYALALNFTKILFSPIHRSSKINFQKIKNYPLETLSQWIFLILVIGLGVYPPKFLTDFIQLAVSTLPHFVKL